MGKTRSVGVKPFHFACCSGPEGTGPDWLLTRIMKAMVRPRSTSMESRRLGFGAVCTTSESTVRAISGSCGRSSSSPVLSAVRMAAAYVRAR